jgi:hypothetical protein
MTRCIEQLATHGEPIASADMLAEAVSELVQVEPSGARPVVVLSATETEGLFSGTELHKLEEGEGPHGFTVRMQRGLSSTASERQPPVQRGRPKRRVLARWAPIGIALAGLLVWVAVRGWPHGERVPQTQPANSESTGVSGIDPSQKTREERLPGATQSLASSPAMRVTTSDAPAPSGPSRGEHRGEHGPRSAHPREPAKEAVPPAHGQETPSSAWCRGQLHLYAAHGWLLSGGPSVVQAPGRYDWPCGTYTLRATSRTNPLETRTITVTIRETSPDVVDLR